MLHAPLCRSESHRQPLKKGKKPEAWKRRQCYASVLRADLQTCRKRSETVLKQFLNKWCRHVCWAPPGFRSGFPCSCINHCQYNQSIESRVRSTAGETYWIAAIQRPPRTNLTSAHSFISQHVRRTFLDIPKHEAFTPDGKLSEDTIYRSIKMYVWIFQLNR